MSSENASVRDRILELARERFFQYGFRTITTDELAFELGISKKTLYRHFASKRQLLHDAVMSQFELVYGEIHVIVSSEGLSFPEKFVELVQTIGRRLPHPSRVFLQDIRRHAPEVWEELDQRRIAALRESFGRLLIEGKAQGYVRNEVGDELFLLIFQTLVQRLISPDVLSELPISAGQLYREIAGFLALGILTVEGREMYRTLYPTEGVV